MIDLEKAWTKAERRELKRVVQYMLDTAAAEDSILKLDVRTLRTMAYKLAMGDHQLHADVRGIRSAVLEEARALKDET